MMTLDVIGFVNSLHLGAESVANNLLETQLPTIHAHLISGMVVGSEVIKKDRLFYQALVDTSLVHVVVVSGYNINLVLKGIESLFKLKYNFKSFIFLIGSLLLYMFLCGLTAPVVRAGIMGFLSYFARFSGRSATALYIFLLTVVLMLLLNFDYFTSLSFWLSSGATIGLILFAEPISSFFTKLLSESADDCHNMTWFKGLCVFLAGEMSTTLAASLIVTPIIAYNFGRLNLFAPIYNVLSLWLIPIITILGFIHLILSFLFGDISFIFGWIIYVPTTLFINLVRFFNSIPIGNLNLNLSLNAFIIYYVLLLLYLLRRYYARKHVT